jgi:hypothetical protein
MDGFAASAVGRTRRGEANFYFSSSAIPPVLLNSSFLLPSLKVRLKSDGETNGGAGMLACMKTLRLVHLATAVTAAFIAICVIQPAAAATIPAGTAVVVATTATITSVDARGTRVPAVLARPLLSNGRVAVPAGSKVMGQVVSSRRIHHSHDRLTVDITDISVQGRTHHIRTTGPALVDNQTWSTRTGSTVSRAGYTVRAGRHLHFQLAQPLAF